MVAIGQIGVDDKCMHDRGNAQTLNWTNRQQNVQSLDLPEMSEPGQFWVLCAVKTVHTPVYFGSGMASWSSSWQTLSQHLHLQTLRKPASIQKGIVKYNWL